MKKVICILRHGQTLHNLNHQFSSINEVCLTSWGEQQARLLGKAMAHFAPKKIVASDLKGQGSAIGEVQEARLSNSIS